MFEIFTLIKKVAAIMVALGYNPYAFYFQKKILEKDQITIIFPDYTLKVVLYSLGATSPMWLFRYKFIKIKLN